MLPDCLPPDTEVSGSELEVARVPQNNRRDEQVQLRGAVSLVLEGPVTHLAQALEEDHAGQRKSAAWDNDSWLR